MVSRIDLSEKVETLQNILLSQATGGGADNEGYTAIRHELMAVHDVWPMLPRFVHTCRDLSQFWAYIKQRFSTYQERRDYIWDEFAPTFSWLEDPPFDMGGAASLDSPSSEGISSHDQAVDAGKTDAAVSCMPQQQSKSLGDRQIRILFLASNPADTQPLRLDAEIRAIEQALRESEFRDRFDIKQYWAVRILDLQGYLLRHQPDIVHFSGHGSKEREIILEDESGESRPVSNRALGQLFSVLKDNIRCVVLNACFSERQARSIADNIDCVIGMSGSVGDDTARSFASAFYQALGYGRDVKTAFELGCVQIDLESLDEKDVPKLIALRCDPSKVIFTPTT